MPSILRRVTLAWLPDQCADESECHVIHSARHDLLLNVALKPDGTVWWEGHDDRLRPSASTGRGSPGLPSRRRRLRIPIPRFTAPMRNNPMLAPEAEDPRGVPIDALIFGGRRPNTVPLVFQAFHWSHGVFLGRRWAARPRRRRRARWVRCGGIRWRCSCSADTTWDGTSGIGWTCGSG